MLMDKLVGDLADKRRWWQHVERAEAGSGGTFS